MFRRLFFGEDGKGGFANAKHLEPRTFAMQRPPALPCLSTLNPQI
jgi:hypothetical protein